MADIFISYKREERESARRVAEALEAYGFSVWWDGDLLPGEQYRTVTLEILDTCRAAIVLWSARSAVSGWVLDEAQRAMSKGKLIPVRIEGFTDYPLGFGQLHAHDLAAWDGDPAATAFLPVVSAVERLVGRKREMRPQEAPPSPPAPAELDREIGFWRGVHESRDPADLQAYLDRFGEASLFGELARRRLAALKAAHDGGVGRADKALTREPAPPPKPKPTRTPAARPAPTPTVQAGPAAKPGWPARLAAVVAVALLAPLATFPIGWLMDGRKVDDALDELFEGYGAPGFYVMVAVGVGVLFLADWAAGRMIARGAPKAARPLLVVGAPVLLVLVLLLAAGGGGRAAVAGVLWVAAAGAMLLWMRRRQAAGAADPGGAQAGAIARPEPLP